MTVWNISELINEDYNKFLEFNEKIGNEMLEELIYNSVKDTLDEFREYIQVVVNNYRKFDNSDIYYDDLLKPTHDLREFYKIYILSDSSREMVDDFYSEELSNISNCIGIDYGKKLRDIVNNWRDPYSYIDTDEILDMIEDEIFELESEPFDYDYESESVHSIPFDSSDRIFSTIIENLDGGFQNELYWVKDEVLDFRNSPNLQVLSKTAKDLGLEYDDEKNEMLFNKRGD